MSIIKVALDQFLPVPEARERFLAIVDRLASTTDPTDLYVVTKDGKPAAAVINIDSLIDLMKEGDRGGMTTLASKPSPEKSLSPGPNLAPSLSPTSPAPPVPLPAISPSPLRPLASSSPLPPSMSLRPGAPPLPPSAIPFTPPPASSPAIPSSPQPLPAKPPPPLVPSLPTTPGLFTMTSPPAAPSPGGQSSPLLKPIPTVFKPQIAPLATTTPPLTPLAPIAPTAAPASPPSSPPSPVLSPPAAPPPSPSQLPPSMPPPSLSPSPLSPTAPGPSPSPPAPTTAIPPSPATQVAATASLNALKNPAPGIPDMAID